jgi:hypothetical protein
VLIELVDVIVEVIGAVPASAKEIKSVAVLPPFIPIDSPTENPFTAVGSC